MKHNFIKQTICLVAFASLSFTILSQEIVVHNLVLCQNDASPQNVTLDPSNDLNGFNVTGLFQNCLCLPGTIATDYCYQKIKELNPQVLRFPSGAESKFMNLLGDTQDYTGSGCADSWSLAQVDVNGYGFIPEEIKCYLLNNFSCASHAACYGINADYTAAYDEYIGSYNFITHTCPTYDSEVCRQIFNDHTPYIDRFITLIQELQSDGIDPKVIYVANIHTATPDYNVDVIDYLIANGVNVTGVELGNEEYSAKNNTGYLYTNFTSYRNFIKPYISAIRNYNSTIKIAVTAAPPGNITYNGDYVYPTTSRNRYNNWNNSMGSNYTFDWPSPGIDAWDANVVHIYVEEKMFNTAMNNLYTSYFDNCPNEEITFSEELDEAYLPLEDGSFDLRWDEHEFLFDYDDNGEGIEQFISLYNSSLQLGGSNDNNLWITEYNAKSISKTPLCSLTPVNVDFLNTYAQSSLLFNWIMRNIDISEIDLPTNTSLEYNTVQNLLGANLALIQTIGSLDQLDPDPYDAALDANYFDDEFRLRSGYYPFLYTSEIFADDLIRVKANAYIEAPGSPPGASILYLYTYVKPDLSEIYYFFNTNHVGSTIVQLMSNPFQCKDEGYVWSTQCTPFNSCGYDAEIQGYDYMSTKYVSYIDAKNVYSTAGSATIFKENDFYNTNIPEFEIYGKETTFTGNTWTIPDLSIGYIRCPLYDACPGVGWDCFKQEIEESNDQSLVIFPNPTRGEITVSNVELKNSYLIQITSAAGEILKTEKIDSENSNNFVIDLNEYCSGVYFISINSAQKNWNGKVILIK